MAGSKAVEVIMDKDQNKYNLEEFFRSHLENYESAENGWNVPPDDVWQQVQTQIHTSIPRTKFPLFGKNLLLWCFLVLLLAVIAYQFIKNKNEIFRLNSELEAVKSELQDIQQLVPTAETSLQAEAAGSDQATVLPNRTSRSSKNTRLGFSRIEDPSDERQAAEAGTPPDEDDVEKNNFSAPAASTAIPLPDEAGSGVSRIPSTSETTGANEAAGPPITNEAAEPTLWTLSQLPDPEIPELINKPTALTIDPLIEKIRSAKPPPAIKLSSGPMWVERVQDTFPKGFEDYLEHQFSGFSVGLHLEWPLSHRLFLESGVNYLNYSAESFHERHIHYNDANTNLPGLGPNDFQISKRLHSAVGHVRSNLIFTRDPSDPLPNRRFDIAVNSRTSVHYLGVPLLLKYRITKGRLGLFLRGGLRGSMRIGQQFQVTHIEVPKENIRFRSSESTSEIEEVKRYHLQYLLGGGIEYHLSPNYAIHIEPSYSRSLSVLTTIEGVHMRLRNLSINGGLKLHF